jgi:hypothetical protein
MIAAAESDNPGSQFAIELTYSWTSHSGDERRQTQGQIDQEDAVWRKASVFEEMTGAFQAMATPIATECKRSVSTFEHTGRFFGGVHYNDGGLDVTHVVAVAAACAGAVPLSLIIKAARDVLVKWLGIQSHGIKVKLGGGRAIEVNNTAELDKVLARLDKSEFAKATLKPTPKDAATRTSKTTIAKTRTKGATKRKP